DPVQYDARVIGGDVGAGLAVLDIDANDLPTVTLGDSDALQLGQRVVAVGYALGLEGGPSVTAGIVSSLTRQIDVQDTGCPVSECGADQTRVYDHVTQTDAAINPRDLRWTAFEHGRAGCGDQLGGCEPGREHRVRDPDRFGQADDLPGRRPPITARCVHGDQLRPGLRSPGSVRVRPP